MTRRRFIRSSALCAAGVMAGPCRISTQVQAQAAANAPARRPNIVLILADDLGYGDLGCYGGRDTKTPHIDRLAADGVRFTDAYACAPLCAPARAGLLTGRYPQRFGFEFNPIRPAPADWGIAADQRLLSEDLKAAGYATGLVGKWHLGPGADKHPVRRGFDEFFGFVEGKHRYLEAGRKEPNNPIMRGQRPVDEQAYLTEAFTREAVEFIERHKGEPFFLHLAPNAVHVPHQRPPDQYYERFGHIKDEARRIYAAILSALDDQVGAVTEKLKQAGLLENTLVMFMSDNGGLLGPARNAPLRGVKTEMYEGGIRVPLIFSQPGKIPAGTFSHPVSLIDLHPTCVAAGGGKGDDPLRLDGRNLLPYLEPKALGGPHDMLYWRHGPEMAIRWWQWKLLRLSDGSQHLYNLSEDIGETRDLAKSEPKRAAELLEHWKKWDEKNVAAKWAGFQKNFDS